MAIVNYRGTNGSGKSTVAHNLLKGEKYRKVVLAETGKRRPVEGWLLDDGTVVVGRYETKCGGCDGIATQDLVCEAVRKAADYSDRVFFEGLLVSGIYRRYHDLDRELTRLGHLYTWAFAQISVEQCLKNVYKRNGGKKIKEELVQMKYNGVTSCFEKATIDGLYTKIVPWRNATKVIRSLLLESA